jgi:hypothetical protein
MFNNDLLNYATESGVVEEEQVSGQNDALVDVLVNEAASSPSETVTSVMDQAESTAEVAEQLEDLADRAEAVAEKAQEAAQGTGVVPADVVVATESMHREYATVMRAYKLVMPATSFEAAGSDYERLRGIATDARRTANLARGSRDAMLDYSEEGALLSFIRRDASKLDTARQALGTAGSNLQRHIDNVREKPVGIKNMAFARFMTREGQPVKDLPRALTEEATYLGKVHDAAQAGAVALGAMADQLAGGAPVTTLINRANIFGALSQLETNQGQLMGNFSFRINSGNNTMPGVSAPKFSRVSENKVNGKDIVWGIIGAYGGAFLGYNAGALVVLGGVMAGIAVPLSLITAATIGGTAALSKATYNSSADHTEVKSQAGVKDLQTSINLVLGFRRYLDYKVDSDTIQAKIKAARGAGKSLAGEDRKLHNSACDEMETSLSRLVRLAELVYEQAFYDTTMLAALVDGLVNRSH